MVAETIFRALGLGGDSTELLWALKSRRGEVVEELGGTQRRIAALEAGQARRALAVTSKKGA